MFHLRESQRRGEVSPKAMIALAGTGTLLAVILIWRLMSGSPYETVHVSGMVRADQQPLSGVTVVFAPMPSKKNPYPGPASHGVTDSSGRFSLRLVGDGTAGALVGNHRVRLSLPAAQAEEGLEPNDNIYDFLEEDLLPPEYNSATTLTYLVPPEGTEEANFDVKLKTEDVNPKTK